MYNERAVTTFEAEIRCRVCESDALTNLFQSSGKVSFTSAQEVVPLKVRVMFCKECAHAQTPPLANIGAYYDKSYNYRNRELDEDDIYEAKPGSITYRADHQALVLERLYEFSKQLRVLDFGCGKASTLRKLAERHPAIVPYVFDVSEAYVEYWGGLAAAEHQATYEIPASWSGQLDLILSLFSLEHVEDPRSFVRTLHSLLRSGGRVHIIVPHLYRNASDLLVADHVSHFSTASVRRLFQDAGFGDIEIDTNAHRAALVVSASRESCAGETRVDARSEVEEVERQAFAIAGSWGDSTDRILDAERHNRGKKAAIYGSGVYGLFIAATLKSLDDVLCFVDASPYRQGLTLMNLPVIAPEELDDAVEIVLVGLNPRDARRIIEQADSLHAVKREFVFI